MCTFNLNRVHIKQFLKRLLTGITVPQEYVCVDKNSFQSPVSVSLQFGSGSTPIDVTGHHIFVAYKPVIIAFVPPDPGVKWEAEDVVTLKFCQGSECIATLLLGKDRSVLAGSTPVYFYQATRGDHSFLDPAHRIINHLRQSARRNKPGNVGLKGNLYDQVRIAYSVPRIISVITLGSNDRMNMFPTDLHGMINKDFYLSSLRIGSAATQEVEQIGKIVLSNVKASACREVYKLGKNHMQALAPRTGFSCAGESKTFHTPIPKAAVSYCELERISSFDIGIHRIHLYRIISVQPCEDDNSILAHIHQYYAQWRLDRKIPTDIMIR